MKWLRGGIYMWLTICLSVVAGVPKCWRGMPLRVAYVADVRLFGGDNGIGRQRQNNQCRHGNDEIGVFAEVNQALSYVVITNQ